MYITFNNKNNKEGPKFDNDDHVRISKYKNIFQIELMKFLRLKKLKALCHGHMVLVI